MKIFYKLVKYLIAVLFSVNILSAQILDKVNEKNILKILPLGNSITFDKRTNDTRPVSKRIGYRFDLYKLLNGIGINFNYIGSEHSGSDSLLDGNDRNAGFPGIKDDQLAVLLQSGWRIQPPDFNQQITIGPYLETYLPDLILLHIGTNGNDLVDGTSSDDIEEILNEIDRVEDLFNTKINVAVARIIDRSPNQSYVNELNNNIELLVEDRVNNPSNTAYPDNLILVDMEDGANFIYSIDSAGTIGNGILGDMNDTLHPNDKGFIKMAEVWFDAIKKLYPNTINITKQPHNFYAISGKKAIFKVNATSDSLITFQWKKNGIIIPEATDSVYEISFVALEENQSKFTCDINSGYYTISSDTAVLFVTDSLQRISKDLVAFYNFDEKKGDLISNSVIENSNLNLQIDDTNNVEWFENGLKIFDNINIFTQEPAVEIYDGIVKKNEMTLEAWIESNENGSEESNIISYSENSFKRNFTIGKNNNKYEIKLRSTETDLNGNPPINSSSKLIDDKVSHIALTKDTSGTLNFYIDGEIDTTINNIGNFSNWDSTYSLSLANEFLDNKLWLGKFYLVGIYNRALSEEEIIHNFNIKFNGFDSILQKPTDLSAEIVNETDVLLNWVYNSNREAGFIIERRLNEADSVFTFLDKVDSNILSYVDSKLKIDSSYVYRIRAFNKNYYSDFSDEIIVSNIPVGVLNSDEISNNFKLLNNFPNPFNPSTRIEFSIPKKSKIDLIVYNSLGEIVKYIFKDKLFLKGKHSAVFNAQGLSSGVYFYKITAKPIENSPIFIKINKAIFLK